MLQSFIDFWESKGVLVTQDKNWDIHEFNPGIFSLTHFNPTNHETNGFKSVHALITAEGPDGTSLILNNDSDMTEYNLPGGKKEADESEIETLQREIMEELGLTFHSETVRKIGDLTINTVIFPMYDIPLSKMQMHTSWSPMEHTIGIRIIPIKTFMESIEKDTPFAQMMDFLF